VENGLTDRDRKHSGSIVDGSTTICNEAERLGIWGRPQEGQGCTFFHSTGHTSSESLDANDGWVGLDAHHNVVDTGRTVTSAVQEIGGVSVLGGDRLQISWFYGVAHSRSLAHGLVGMKQQ
jgi:hypothetical protein